MAVAGFFGLFRTLRKPGHYKANQVAESTNPEMARKNLARMKGLGSGQLGARISRGVGQAQGFGEVKALTEVASHVAQKLDLGRIVDALGDGFEIEGPGPQRISLQ